MTNVKIYLVEDDPIVALDIERMLNEIGYLLVGTSDNANEAIKNIAKMDVDLVLMDINIKGRMNGIEVAKKVVEMEIPVIFLTGLEEPQVFQAAREVSSFGYLVKPVSRFTLQSNIDVALSSASNRIPLANSVSIVEEQKKLNDTFFFKSGDKYIKVRTSDILVVEANGNYSIIYTSKRKFAIKTPLKEMKLKLSSLLFVQVHRSCIVQLTEIESINITDMTISVNNREISIGKSYKAALLQKLNKF